jgi:hypothetical protein
MGTGVVVGIIIVVLVIVLLLLFGLPRLGGGGGGAAPEAGAPAGVQEQGIDQGIDVDVPKELDVDVNQP